MPKKPKKFDTLISMKISMKSKARVEAYTAKHETSFSAFVREAVNEKLERERAAKQEARKMRNAE
jgi:hypothetical protein